MPVRRSGLVLALAFVAGMVFGLGIVLVCISFASADLWFFYAADRRQDIWVRPSDGMPDITTPA